VLVPQLASELELISGTQSRAVLVHKLSRASSHCGLSGTQPRSHVCNEAIGSSLLLAQPIKLGSDTANGGLEASKPCLEAFDPVVPLTDGLM
jgi:hypothetical protein